MSKYKVLKLAGKFAKNDWDICPVDGNNGEVEVYATRENGAIMVKIGHYFDEEKLAKNIVAKASQKPLVESNGAKSSLNPN